MRQGRRMPHPAATGRSALLSEQQHHHTTTAAPIDKVLARLEKVRANGRDKWMACCPAHDDRSPSLSIRETSEGVILCHCFAGCTAAEVVESVGLRLRDLFPWRPQTNQRAKRQGLPEWRRRKLLEAYEDEALIIRCFAGKLEHKETPTQDDCDRLALAWETRRAIAEELSGGAQ